MTILYTYEGEQFEAELIKIENGKIYAKTLQSNGDYTHEHELPLADIIRTIS